MACAISDLESCYDTQVHNIRGIVEESTGVSGEVMRLITKILPRMEHHVGVGHGLSERWRRGKQNKFGGAGQGNAFSGSVCRDASCEIFKELKKKEGLE